MFLLLVLYPILEIYAIFEIGARIGFINTFFAFLACFVLGLGFAKAQGRYVLGRMQEALSQQRMPNDDVLHGLVTFAGGILLAIPGFISDAIALLLILPGTRHLIVYFLKTRFAPKIKDGSFKVFSFGGMSGMGMGNMGGMGSRPTSGPTFEDEEPRWEREVSPLVIDVTPIKPNQKKTE